jgi:hypothetical protein
MEINLDSARGSVFISISNVFKVLLQISMFMILFEWFNVVAIGSNGDGVQRDHAIGSHDLHLQWFKVVACNGFKWLWRSKWIM